jgi:hypothetical protein
LNLRFEEGETGSQSEAVARFDDLGKDGPATFVKIDVEATDSLAAGRNKDSHLGPPCYSVRTPA